VSDSYWLDAARAFEGSPISPSRVNVAIVGAGITGCAAALRLAERGASVRVHEAGTIASGASGRSGGFVLRGGALAYDRARDAYGRDAARHLWRWSEAALDRLAELAGDSFARVGSLRLAADEAELAAIRSEYDALHEDGFDVEWQDDVPNGFHGAFLHPHDGSFHPVRFVHKLVERAAAHGVEFVEHDDVKRTGQLDADAVLLATDGLGGELVPGVRPIRNQVLLTAPHAEHTFARPHYARYGHAYWHHLDDGRLLLGGFRDVAPGPEETVELAITPAIQDALERFLRDTLHADAPIERRWSGIFGGTADALPLAGRLRENVWVAAGYTGHGNVLGLACGELVADAIVGDGDEALLLLFDPTRPATSRSA
jgi:gamma-glutamylputrescine oxidase